MEKENIIEILEDFIDFLKEKEEEDSSDTESDTAEVEVIVEPDDIESDFTEDTDDFDKVINKISKGE